MADDARPDGSEVADAIYRSLRTVLDGERFLITNDSMRRLLQLYRTDFVRANSQRAVLRDWRRNAAFFRDQWLDVARQRKARFGGALLPVATESATAKARDRCRREKRRGPGRQETGGH